VFPVLKSIGRAILPMALSSGRQVLSDVSEGQNLGASLRRQGTSLAKQAVNRALTGAGKKRKRKRSPAKSGPPAKKKSTKNKHKCCKLRMICF